MSSIASSSDDAVVETYTDMYTTLRHETILDNRISDTPFRLLVWALTQDASDHHTVTSIARKIDQSEKRVRASLAHLRELGYVTLMTSHQKGRQGMTSNWTFHYPPLPVPNGDDPLRSESGVVTNPLYQRDV